MQPSTHKLQVEFPMDAEDLKALTQAVQELSSSSKETANAIHDFSDELRNTRRLWKQGKRPILIQIGIALIAFPDPTISDVVGAAFIAAGLIQMKMRNSALHVEDVYKTFPKVIKELSTIKQGLV
jgi:hypothetical protein